MGGFIQYGPTVDAGLGLLAAGGQEDTLAALTAFMTTETALDEYLHGAGFDRPDAAYAGPTGKLGYFVSITGGDPRDVAGEDLVETLLSLETNTGRFVDRSDFGDFSNVIGQSFAIVSLTAAEGIEPSAAAISTLLGAQCDDGGFTLTFDGGACTGTPDVTGLAVQALNAADPGESEPLTPEREAALVAAARWLEDHREADGSYVMDGQPNVNSTGYAALGVFGAGLDAVALGDVALERPAARRRAAADPGPGERRVRHRAGAPSAGRRLVPLARPNRRRWGGRRPAGRPRADRDADRDGRPDREP